MVAVATCPCCSTIGFTLPCCVRSAGAPMGLPLGPATSDTPPKPPVRHGFVETFLIISGKNVLPAAPSPGPSVTFNPDVRQGPGPLGEAADDDVEGADGLPADELADEELFEPLSEVESELEPQPPSSRSAAPSTTTVDEGFFTVASIEQNRRNTGVRRPVLGRGRERVSAARGESCPPYRTSRSTTVSRSRSSASVCSRSTPTRPRKPRLRLSRSATGTSTPPRCTATSARSARRSARP